jgi:hypothetical protein
MSTPADTLFRAPPDVTWGSTSVQATSYTVAKQTGTAPGDLVLMYAWGPTTASSVTGAAFTIRQGANGYGVLMARVIDGSEPANFVITGIPAGRHPCVCICTIRGLAGGGQMTPAVGSLTPADAGLVGTFTASSISPASPVALLFFHANQNGWSGANSSPVTSWPPSGWTSVAATPNAVAQNRATVVCGVQNTIQPAGATGTRAITVSPNSYGSAVLVGVIPAPVSVPALGRLRAWDGTQWRDVAAPSGLRFWEGSGWNQPVPV